MLSKPIPVSPPSPLNDAWGVILAGGSGTRLWPASRERLPKQYLKLGGEKSLIHATIDRLGKLVPTDRMLIVSGQAGISGLPADLSKIATLVEPASRNTAAAIGLAALHLSASGRDPIMIVAPSDHVVSDESAFVSAVTTAVEAARDGELVTLGIHPSRPDTGFGYIHAPGDGWTARRVRAFREKPDIDAARMMLSEGGWHWNAGIFVWRASTVLAELAAHASDVFAVLENIRQAAATGSFSEAISQHFPRCPNISIDKAVMERSARVVTVPVDMGWSDVGTWDAVADMAEKDASGNSAKGNVLSVSTHDTHVRAEHRLVATVGVSDLVIVETRDAVLVAGRNQTQDVKQLVELLRQKGAPEQTEHLTVERPWGSYTVLQEGPGFKLKSIDVRPGGRLSLQSHRHRSEHWVVIAGVATVTCDSEIRTVQANESTFIPVGAKHRLENLTEDELVIIEVQVGSYVGEDDIQRYDDVYGRVPAPVPGSAP